MFLSRSCIILSFLFSSRVHFECSGFALSVLVFGCFVLFACGCPMISALFFFLKTILSFCTELPLYLC